MKLTAILAVFFMFIGSLSLSAGEKAGKHVDFEGKLVCLGCDLKSSEDARAACSVYGHKHALKTDDGKYITFLENQYSEDLIKGEKYQNKDIKVHGVYHASANQLDVESFEVDGKTNAWCGNCKAMDGCAAGKGM